MSFGIQFEENGLSKSPIFMRFYLLLEHRKVILKVSERNSSLMMIMSKTTLLLVYRNWLQFLGDFYGA